MFDVFRALRQRDQSLLIVGLTLKRLGVAGRPAPPAPPVAPSTAMLLFLIMNCSPDQ